MAKIRNITDYRKIRLRNFLIICCILFPVLIYLGICFSGLFAVDVSTENLDTSLAWCLTHPVSCWNEKTKAVLAVVSLVWFVFTASQYVKMNNNLMHGQEFGAARWGDIRAFNQKYGDKKEENNKILSENIRFRYDSSTLRNNNIFVTGGSGVGKTAFFLTPNILNAHGSNIINDPKGSLIEEVGCFLEKRKDTRIYTINLCEMEKSMKFNPFLFLHQRQDVTKLVSNLIQNTNNDQIKNNTADPFWEKAERMFLESIFLYIWLECPTTTMDKSSGEVTMLEKNWGTVIKLLDEAQFLDSDSPTRLDERMGILEKRNPGHPAARVYRKYRSGPTDTVRSVIMTVNARMQPFDNEDLLNIFSGNEIPLDEIGVGKDGDGATRTDLFLITPDDDDTYNFVPGIVYTLLFQILYRQARLYGGRLPIDVGFWLDEFANTKMPSNFERILATCRSRGVYLVPMLQSLSQIKKLMSEGAWEGVVGNCDTFLYLGGNEPSTFEFISKLLGKWTIDKKTSGESKGTSGSYSENFDVLGRELMLDYEVRLLPEDECILFVRGEEPLRDKKWFPWEHDVYKQAVACGKYESKEVAEKEKKEGAECIFLTEQSLDYYKKASQNDTSIRCYEIDALDFMSMDLNQIAEDSEDKEISFTPDMLQNLYRKEKDQHKKELEQKYIQEFESLSLLDIYASDQLDPIRRNVVKELKQKNIEDEIIKSIIHPLLTEEQMFRKKNACLEMNSV